MPNLFSNLSECFGFSHIIKSPSLRASTALSEISFRFPMGVATMCIPKLFLFIIFLNIFIASCTSVNLTKQSEESKNNQLITDQEKTTKNKETIFKEKSLIKENETENYEEIKVKNNITVLFSNQNKENFTKQFINLLELGIYNKNLQNVDFEIQFFDSDMQLKNIISREVQEGKIFIGPIETQNTKIAKTFCNNKIVFFSFSSDTSISGECIYLINFFPKNELEELFSFLNKDSRVALLYPENDYGYMINSLIDDVVNKTDAILINRSSYKKDLSNVRNAIKELGKYELRKYELDRQKQILSNKNDEFSKKRLKKLQKFQTTSDYDFTHILIADYGLNLLQVAPLLPYYDIDPEVVQFLSTGVIDDENFFFEPSLQGTIFPGIEKNKRLSLISQYEKIYDEKLLRISTLSYDLVGLLNYVFSRNMTIDKMIELLNSPAIKFDGVDGEFYFQNNMIQRNLDILKISNGVAKKIN